MSFLDPIVTFFIHTADVIKEQFIMTANSHGGSNEKKEKVLKEIEEMPVQFWFYITDMISTDVFKQVYNVQITPEESEESIMDEMVRNYAEQWLDDEFFHDKLKVGFLRLQNEKNGEELDNNGHDYIDLGLSVKWATCNVGATKPEDNGSYFAWGETSPKDSSTRDAARANWGGTWRMPTDAEMEELIENCEWEWTTLGGKIGHKVTSKKNGNSIFLPPTGIRCCGEDIGAGSDEYWSSSSCRESYDEAWSMFLESEEADDVQMSETPRYYGVCVRPVLGSTLDGTRENEEEQNDVYFDNNGHDFIDLGLSVKWATCNVGATKPEDNGSYFAWGETSPKDFYSEDNYNTLNNPPDDKKYDSKTRLDPIDDAATANWGGKWRMPTDAEMEELIENCEWERTTLGGNKGYKVTSKKNGNSIFLPAAGFIRDPGLERFELFDTRLFVAGFEGDYWAASRHLYGSFSSRINSRYMFFSNKVIMDYDERDMGFSVRPVLAEDDHLRFFDDLALIREALLNGERSDNNASVADGIKPRERNVSAYLVKFTRNGDTPAFAFATKKLWKSIADNPKSVEFIKTHPYYGHDMEVYFFDKLPATCKCFLVNRVKLKNYDLEKYETIIDSAINSAKKVDF